MQSAAHNEGRGVAYWLSLVGFAFFASVGLSIALWGKPEERSTGWGTVALFAAFTLIFGLWPVFRRREFASAGSRPRLERIGAPGHPPVPAFRLPYSRSKLLTFFCLSVIVALTGGAMLARVVQIGSGKWVWTMYGLNPLNSGMILLGGLAMTGAALRDLWRGKLGISLRPDGIIWDEMFHGPVFIPWIRIDAIGVFQSFKTPQNSTHHPSVGLRVREVYDDAADTLKGHRQRFAQNRSQQGWDLYLYSESMTLPVETVAAGLQWYLTHPPQRMGLGTPEEFVQFLAFLERVPTAKSPRTPSEPPPSPGDSGDSGNPPAGSLFTGR